MKPRVMLIPDAVDWILGTWAKEIAKWNSDKYEFVIFPMTEIRENPDLFRCVLAQIDIVHCLSQWAFSQIRAMIAKAKYRHLKLISTIHHIVKLSQVGDCLKADKIMVVCQKYLNELIAYGVPREQIVLIYNGVDAKFFSPRDTVKARRSFGISDGVLTIGFSAKATSDHDGRKGIDVFCRTLSTLRDRIKADVHVILTGPGWENLKKHTALDRIALHYFPFLPASRMPEFYNAIDVYLVTARVEGGPVPLLEAMSCGTPVITTPVGTALDIIRNGHNGLMIPFDEVEEAVNAIERIHCDANLASRLRSTGRETILQNLQWKDTVLKIDQLYGESRKSTNRTTLHVPESLSCAELTAVLIAKDTARWQRDTAPIPKFFGSVPLLPWAKKLTSLPKRFYSKVIRYLRRVGIEKLMYVSSAECGPRAIRAVRFVNQMYDSISGGFRSTPAGPVTLYGTCYASLVKSYLGFDVSLSEQTLRFISECQDPETGLMIGPELRTLETAPGVLHDREHLLLHLTCAATPVCQHFGVKLPFPIRQAHRFCDRKYLQEWLDKRDFKNAWFEGNNIFFVGQLLVYLRDEERHPDAPAALDYWFEWLDRHVDPATGLWGTNGYCSAMEAVYGGYHQLLVYYHENHPLRNPQGLVDTVLGLQHPDGGFNPRGNGGACEDVDSVDILVNLYKRSDYRRPEIRCALRQCLRHILALQNPDGGFPYNRNCRQSHMGIPGTEASPNQSTMFATWLRVHTLALMAEILTDDSELQFPFRFTNTLSMGWHQTWSKAEHPITAQDREGEREFERRWQQRRAFFFLKRQSRAFARVISRSRNASGCLRRSVLGK